jgi:hypothetical protein
MSSFSTGRSFGYPGSSFWELTYPWFIITLGADVCFDPPSHYLNVCTSSAARNGQHHLLGQVIGITQDSIRHEHLIVRPTYCLREQPIAPKYRRQTTCQLSRTSNESILRLSRRTVSPLLEQSDFIPTTASGYGRILALGQLLLAFWVTIG